MTFVLFFFLSCGDGHVAHSPKPAVELVSWDACKHILVKVVEAEKNPVKKPPDH